MRMLFAFCRRLDAMCARLNDGLAAVAVVLVIATVMVSIAHYPDLVTMSVETEMGLTGATE
jgi:hypothetical protein